MHRLRVTPSLLVLACTCLAGCASAPEQPTASGGSVVEQEVLATVRAVKSGTAPHFVSSRAVRLPTLELYAIAIFDYDLPPSCGGYRFRVYESGTTQILEYAYERDGETHFIRDYVTGSSPFIHPGLWSSFDHTADSVTEMMTLFAEGERSRLTPRVYSKGLVTGLAVMTQEELGTAYLQAIKAAAECDARS